MSYEYNPSDFVEYDLQDKTYDEILKDFRALYGYRPTKAIFSSQSAIQRRKDIDVYVNEERPNPFLVLVGPVFSSEVTISMIASYFALSKNPHSFFICPDYSGALINDKGKIVRFFDNIEELDNFLNDAS